MRQGAHVEPCTWKKACLKMEPEAPGNALSGVDLDERLAAEDSYDLHAAVDLHRISALRHCDDGSQRVQPGRGSCRNRSARPHQQGDADIATADIVQTENPEDAGRAGSHSRNVVQRRVSAI